MNFSFVKRGCSIGLLVICLSVGTPLAAFCQEQDQMEEESYDDPANESTNGTSIGSTSPWGSNSSTTPAANGANTSTSAGSSTNSATGTQAPRLGRPARTLGHEPPGNPDVPFDDNMNLMFLVTSLAFAFWVGRKRLKTVVVTNSK